MSEPRTKRRLAAILAADVAGLSILMRTDEVIEQSCYLLRYMSPVLAPPGHPAALAAGAVLGCEPTSRRRLPSPRPEHLRRTRIPTIASTRRIGAFDSP
jgi:hypothetical protein